MSRDADAAARAAAARAADQLGGKLADLVEKAKAPRPAGFRIPELDADPAPDDPTNMWVLADGRLCWRTLDGLTHRMFPWEQLKTKIGSSDTDGGSTSTKPKPADPTPKKHRKTYTATWGRTFCPQHGVETGGSLRYGTFPGSAHGLRRIMFGFNDSAIRGDLAGGTIRAVELSMRNDDAWAFGGIDIVFGAHNRSAAPGSFSAVRRNAWRGHWPHTGYGPTWRNLPDWFGRAFRDNTIKGLTIDQPSGSAAYYGAADWSSLKLRITYTS